MHRHKIGKPTLFSPLTLEVTGEDLSSLDQEAGGHRIQRIPPTESRGRTHTSSVTVAILDASDNNEPCLPSLPKSELKVEWFSGTGCGGQHRNRHMNSARVTHLPTQLVESRQGRSRQSNLNDAIAALSKRVFDMNRGHHNASLNRSRQNQIGTGLRGDKIRTYRFQDDRVIDHKSGKKAKCSKVMKGKFDLLWA